MNLSQTITQLTIRGCHFPSCDQWFIDHIRFIASLAPVTSLSVEMNQFSIDVLISFLQLLPNLDALTIVPTNSSGLTLLTQDQVERIDTLSKINQITKVNVEQHVFLSHIDILINLCLQIQFWRVHCQKLFSNGKSTSFNTNEKTIVAFFNLIFHDQCQWSDSGTVTNAHFFLRNSFKIIELRVRVMKLLYTSKSLVF